MKKLSQYLVAFGILSFLLVPAFNSPALAQTNTSDSLFGITEVNDGLQDALGDEDPRTVIGRIIRVALGFLGVIAVGIILLGGFKWMTAGGNEEKVSESKKLLGAGVIGLAIILAAWALSTYILDILYGATTNTLTP